MSSKPTYSIDAPDQKRLKVARAEIEAILQRHDLAGVVVLHTPGMSEFFYQVNPSYSVVHLDEKRGAVRVRSRLAEDYAGNAAAQLHDQAASANMTAALADGLSGAAAMFQDVQAIVDKALSATHTDAAFTPDPIEGKLQ